MKKLYLRVALVIALIPVRASAQEPAFSTRPGAFFALSVRDIDASARWYAEKLGLRLVTRYPTQNKVAGALLAGGGLEVELIAHEDAVAPKNANDASARVLVHGIFKAGFTVENFDGTVATLRTRGVEIVAGPFPPRRDQRANIIIRDNAGNLIQLFGNFAQ